jgi:hypothetical protein
MAESKFDSSSSNTFPFAVNDCSPPPEDDDTLDTSKHNSIVKTRFFILYDDDDDLKSPSVFLCSFSGFVVQLRVLFLCYTVVGQAAFTQIYVLDLWALHFFYILSI